jgi:hypothetical protein
MGEKYNENEIKNVFKINLENIINYISNFFSLYKNKYTNCIIALKRKIGNLIININKNNNNIDNNSSNTSKHSNQIINNYTHNNNNIIIFDENKKKNFLNQEENIVNLINRLFKQ